MPQGKIQGTVARVVHYIDVKRFFPHNIFSCLPFKDDRGYNNSSNKIYSSHPQMKDSRQNWSIYSELGLA